MRHFLERFIVQFKKNYIEIHSALCNVKIFPRNMVHDFKITDNNSFLFNHAQFIVNIQKSTKLKHAILISVIELIWM
jgi:hypothetical protein